MDRYPETRLAVPERPFSRSVVSGRSGHRYVPERRIYRVSRDRGLPPWVARRSSGDIGSGESVRATGFWPSTPVSLASRQEPESAGCRVTLVLDGIKVSAPGVRDCRRRSIWAAKQVASLQNVSGGRVILGVGAGGDRHQASWAAAGVPRRERGRRTDAALRVLAGLIAGQPTRLDDQPDGPVVQLPPPAAVPPILVGGMSDAALARAAERGDGWFAMTVGGLAGSTARLAELAAARNRPMPQVTGSMLAALRGDPALPDEHTLTRYLADVDGPFGIPAEYVRDMLVTGTTDGVAAHLADAARWGTRRVVVTFAGGGTARRNSSPTPGPCSA